LEQLGEVAYRLAPPSLDGVHDVFHVSQLRRYVRDDSHVLNHTELELRSDLSYTERPMAILDRITKEQKKQIILLVPVSWGKLSPGEARWKREDIIRDHYPHLFHDD